MKKWHIIVIAVLAILLAFSATKDGLIKFSIEKGVQGVTGLKLGISSLRVGILKTMVDINGLKLYNPHGFEDSIMLDMPTIYVDYDLPAFFKGKIHLREVRINMKEFIVEKNSRGELNLDALKMTKDGAAAPAEPKEKGKGMPLQIDTLQLKVGKVIYKDYSQGGAPQVKEFDVATDETYQNITDLQSLVSLIMVKALAKTTISKLANFELDKLQKNLTNQLLSTVSGKLLGGAGGAAVGKALGGLEQQLEESLSGSTSKD